MIVATHEMIDEVLRELGLSDRDAALRAVKKVLGIVERDLASPAMRCEAWLTKDLRCASPRGHEIDTEYAAGTDHLAQTPGGSSVTW